MVCAACGAFVAPALHTDASAASAAHPVTLAFSAAWLGSGESPHDPLPPPISPPDALSYSGTAPTTGVVHLLYPSSYALANNSGAAHTI